MNCEALIALFQRMDDATLLSTIAQIRCRERRELARFLAALTEIDRRHLAQRKAFPSSFIYCVKQLGLSEDEAFRRSRAAKACRRFTFLLSLIEEGALTLSTLCTLEPVLTPENAYKIAAVVIGKSAREVERLVAELAQKVEPRDSIRRLPQAQAADTFVPIKTTLAVPTSSIPSPAVSGLVGALPAPGSAAHWDKIKPLAPGRDGYRFAAPQELRGMLKRIKELLWHKNPKASLGEMLLEVCRFWLAHHDPQQKLKAQGLRIKRRSSDPKSRRIPEWVKDRVRQRDGGCCAFISEDGRRCMATAGLEFDHIMPYACGGRSDDPENIREVCRAHNAYLGFLFFGEQGLGAARPPPR